MSALSPFKNDWIECSILRFKYILKTGTFRDIENMKVALSRSGFSERYINSVEEEFEAQRSPKSTSNDQELDDQREGRIF